VSNQVRDDLAVDVSSANFGVHAPNATIGLLFAFHETTFFPLSLMQEECCRQLELPGGLEEIMTFLFGATSRVVMTISLAYSTAPAAFAATPDASGPCSAIAALSIPADRISLPTSGATIQSATLVTTSETSNQNG
jgi:hypothetical protein